MYWHVTWAARTTGALMFGRLRQPSFPSCDPSVATMTGLNMTSGIAAAALNARVSSSSSQSDGTSMTHSASRRPTCGAARPTPRAWCIVSTMSAASCTSAGVTDGTGRAVSRRTAAPYLTMSRTIA